jgi:iron(III) transport system ATP-binding protein
MNQAARIPEIAARHVGVRVEGVDLSYGSNHVLKAISLEIAPG